MENKTSINHDNDSNRLLADISFVEGDKIAWSTIVNGKIVRLKGDVSSIVGGTMCCIGKCVATGNWWRDYISINDKSISRL
ncbi:MAG: hypothetical protein RBT74_12470 [Tenuifilaceae bacterium]|jgi:hypothetical protein|nr:hypothetical protein [Tenuifilaceae bacterium]